jgi:hypothetical protein
MNKKAKILFFCMIFVASGVFCQITPKKIAFTEGLSSSKSQVQKNNKFNSGFKIAKHNNPGQKIIKLNPEIILTPVFFSLINADYYTQNFGFFCKKELQFEKATKVPFKFRLGTVQYCDWMEGKKTAGILPGN